MQSSAGQYETDLRSTKAEIADLKRMIARLQNEIEAVKAQVHFSDLSPTKLYCLESRLGVQTFVTSFPTEKQP